MLTEVPQSIHHTLIAPETPIEASSEVPSRQKTVLREPVKRFKYSVKVLVLLAHRKQISLFKFSFLQILLRIITVNKHFAVCVFGTVSCTHIGLAPSNKEVHSTDKNYRLNGLFNS